MSGQRSIFRKVSLDRLSSPEQLDQKITVISPIGWVAVISLSILILASIAWGFFGIISNKVNGNGVLMYSGGIINISSQTSGQITEVCVQAGEYVESGQIIARVKQDDLELQIKHINENITALEAVNVETLDIDIGSVNREIYSEFSALAAQILSARIQYEVQGQEVEQYLSSMMEQFTNLKQIMLQDYCRSLDELQTQCSEKSIIVAEFNGIVSGLTVQPYDFVEQGSVLGNIIQGGLEAGSSNVILYVPLDKGKLVEVGMEVNISPTTVNSEEYGYIIGKVVSVSASSVTQEQMMSTLQNQQLVQDLGGDSAVMEIEVELLHDDSTISGYLWSTPKGAPFAISPGTICGGEIKVSEQRPIDMVVPFIKKIF